MPPQTLLPDPEKTSFFSPRNIPLWASLFLGLVLAVLVAVK